MIEWVARSQFASRLFGSPAWPDEVLTAAAGLRTNVTTETRAKWLSRISKAAFGEAERQAKHAIQS